MTKPLVSIIIVNWNGENLLEECLQSVLTTRYPNIEIIVVDNNSTDNSLKVLEKFTSIKVHINKENSGYTGGNNIGFNLAKGKYLVTLNNDVIVEPDWLNKPIPILENEPEIGIISCRQMQYYNKEKVDSLFNDLHADLSFSPFSTNTIYAELPDRFKSIGYILSANGGSAILRKEMLDQTGYFDERFFAYYDETDLCFRAMLYGWKCIYVPDAVVYHKGGESFKRDAHKRLYYRERNRMWFIYKNFPTSLLIKHLPSLLIMELRVIRVLSLKLKSPGTYILARIDAVKMLPIFRLVRKNHLRLFKLQKSRFKALYKKKIIPAQNLSGYIN